ncbi:hypothetical protein D5041_03645 [Verminephrobacter aporrectodeae subsp. tuberculatae]|nr:hypothetical protein [Verminephrobacter aporrectodeae subsp. tuberculatae]MCW5257046.1 hypothetical protein [Verminephrobacter aporrectodeae subsp. tuberculatae]MCW5288186.1 hypothetical protein [Verminephrobacter aporrectodeae subsp. tuberculatae]
MDRARCACLFVLGRQDPAGLRDLFLRSRGLQRNLVVTVNHYAAAYDAIRQSDLMASAAMVKGPGRTPHGRPAAGARPATGTAARGRTVLAPAPRNVRVPRMDENPVA